MARRDLRDDQWERIKDLLPVKASDPGRTAAENRLFVEAILWMARAGYPWRDLPEECGPWNSVYKRFARWSNDGIWHRVFGELCEDADFEAVFMDSTIIKAHQLIFAGLHVEEQRWYAADKERFGIRRYKATVRSPAAAGQDDDPQASARRGNSLP